MTMTAERFAEGMSYEEYKAQMTRNRERLESNEQTLALDPQDLEFFRALPSPVHALVLAEDWCGDVINNLPVLAAMSAASQGKLALRVFLRDQNLDIMDQYLKEGKYRSIPVFAFFDADFQPIGHWIERPRRITALMDDFRRDLFARDEILRAFAPDTAIGELPEDARQRLMAGFTAFRAEHRELSDREVLGEIRALLGGAAPANRLDELRQRALAARIPAARPVKVSITYCSVCGYEPQTLELVGVLMREFIYDLSAIELIPWQDGAFDVVVDGELIHSMARDGGFPEARQVIAAVRERLG